MIIKEYYYKKDDLYRVFVFESNNDLLIPFLKNVLNPYSQNSTLEISFFLLKPKLLHRIFRTTNKSLMIIEGYSYNTSHYNNYILIKKRIEELFQVSVLEVNSLIEINNLNKQIKKKFKFM